MLSIELIVRSDEAKTRNINSNKIFLPFRHIFCRRWTLIFDFWSESESQIFCVFMPNRYGILGTTSQLAKT